MRAATIMGQVRSMLRQAVLDHPTRGPRSAVTALDRAILALPIDATGTPRTQSRRLLAPGTTILLYTDGLTDRAGGDTERDLQRAAALLATHQDQPLDSLLNAVAQIAGPRPADDLALLAIRTR
jgi:serine phosphatase RsbU (regulator of sigma subunit)